MNKFLAICLGLNSYCLAVTSDKFSDLELLAKNYLKETKSLNADSLTSKFGLSIKSNSNKDFPKSGFIGFEYTHKNKESLVKLQLFKNEKGWKVINELPIDKIHIAHSPKLPPTGHKRTDEGIYASKSVGQFFENQLLQTKKILKIRATSSKCYLNKANDRASCLITYGLKKDEKFECLTANFYLSHTNNKWTVLKEIALDEKVDYTTGNLKKSRARKGYCSYTKYKKSS